MRKYPDAAGFQDIERLKQISSFVAVRLRKGQPVSRRNRIGIIVSRPVPCPAAGVAHFKPGILPKLMLDGQVVLQDIGSTVVKILANSRNPQTRAKAVCYDISTGGKRVGIVEEASIAGGGREAGEIRRGQPARLPPPHKDSAALIKKHNAPPPP